MNKRGSSAVKIGIVGTGAITQEVLPLLRSWGWEPVGLCGTSRSKKIVKELCTAHQIPTGYVDCQIMLAEPDVDAVYIAVPNFLHYSFAKQALESNRNVIIEKPLTSNHREAEELSNIARERNLFLFEAISTLYLSSYAIIKKLLPRIGTVKVVSCNFSQYSRRYNAFRAGEVQPVFDPQKSGGAMMDLNLYNLHWLLGLFGEPKSVHYSPNIECGIDTSGVLTLDYDSFQAVSIAAKDCAAPCSYVIQGTAGYIQQIGPANSCSDITLHLNNGNEEKYVASSGSRLEPEFRFFANEIATGDCTRCYKQLDHSLLVSKIQTKARLDAGIRFPADNQS